MAFDVKQFLSSYGKPATGTGGGFDLDSFLLKQGIVKNANLEDSQSMYKFAEAKGLTPPEPMKPLNVLKRVGGILNVGTAATSGFTSGLLKGENPLSSAYSSASESLAGTEIKGFSDVAREQGINPSSRWGKVGLGAGGFVADVLFDPITYLSFGTSAGLKVGEKVLESAGTKLFQDVSTQAVKEFGDKGLRKTELLFEEAIGKKGIDEASVKRLVSEGWKEDVVRNVAKQAEQGIVDKGGIKMFGKSLVTGEQIAKSPLGSLGKAIAATDLYKGLGKTFVADFAKNPKLISIIDKGSQESRRAISGIIESNKKLFKDLNDEQLTNLFTKIWEKKLQVAEAGKKAFKTGEKMSLKQKEVLEASLRTTAKEVQRGEKLIFEDAKLQEVADKLFEPTIENGVTKPSIIQKLAKSAGIPEKEAIKFYIPSKFQEFLDKRGSFGATYGVSSPDLGFTKKFTGVSRADQITNPFELFSRGQIDVALARIKGSTIQAVIKELGLQPSKSMLEEAAKTGVSIEKLLEKEAKRMGYVKFSKEVLGKVEQNVARSEAIKTLTELKETFKKTLRELKSTKKVDRKLVRQIDEFVKTINSLDNKTAKELSDFFSEGAVTKNVSGESKIIKTIPPELQKFEKEAKAIDKIEDVSIELEKAFEDGVLERNGFKDIESFIDAVKNPYSKVEGGDIFEKTIKGDIKNAISLQRKATLIKEKLSKLTDIDKTSIDDSLNNLTKQIDNIKGERKAIRESGVANIPKVEGWIPKEVAEDISKFYEPKSSVIDDLAKATGFDFVTGLFKGYVTSLFPGFHIRNITSNQFQNMLKIGVDVLNPGIQMDALKIVLGKNLDKVLTTKTGEQITLREIRRRVEAQSNILEQGAFGSVEQLIEEGSKNLIKRTDYGKYNPLSRDNIALRAGREIGGKSEAQAKLVSIISAVLEGKSVKEGVKQAEDALFNYSKLTNFEKQVMRRLIPFYTFARKNAELQLKTLATTPGKIATEMKAVKGFGEAVGEPTTAEDQKGLPDYVLESLGIKGGSFFKNKFGQDTYFTGLGLPIEQFLNQFSGDKGIFANTISGILAQANPVIKFSGERATGQDFFAGRPITEIYDAKSLKSVFEAMPKPVANQFKKLIEFQEVPNQPVYTNGKISGYTTKYRANPFALHFLRNLFTSRIQSTVGFLSAEEENNWTKALRFFTGVKGWSIDQEQQKFYKETKYSRELQDYLVRMGVAKKFQRMFVPKEDPLAKFGILPN